MATDQLSEVFDLVEVRGLMSGGFAVRGPWGARTVLGEPLKFIAMVCGRARLTTDGIDGPIELGAGRRRHPEQPVVAGTRRRHRRRTAPRDRAGARLSVASSRRRRQRVDDVVMGGRIDLNPAGQALLLQALPPVGHVRASAAASNLRGASTACSTR